MIGSKSMRNPNARKQTSSLSRVSMGVDQRCVRKGVANNVRTQRLSMPWRQASRSSIRDGKCRVIPQASNKEDGSLNTESNSLVRNALWLNRTPYTIPFLRSGAFAVAAGGWAETLHSIKALSTITIGSKTTALSIIETLVLKGFRPEILSDHVISFLMWSILFFTELSVMAYGKNLSVKDAGIKALEQKHIVAVSNASTVLEREDISTGLLSPDGAPLVEEELKDVSSPASKKGKLNKDSFFAQYVRPKEAERQQRVAVLRNFWYCAAISQNLKLDGSPHKVELLGMLICMWRSKDGSIKAVEDVCPHRGAPLSLGWSGESNGKSCVMCPYHGWAIDGSGRLQDIPSNNDGEGFPKRQLVKSFDVVEEGRLEA